MKLSIIILAAGQGTRMQSSLPKVLQPIGGIPMLTHIINTGRQLQPHNIYVVYGNNGALLKAAYPSENIQWIEQAEPLGTGHAVLQALPKITDDEKILILYGDVPLLSLSALQALLQKTKGDNSIGLMTTEPADPSGLGRILRNDQDEIYAIIEQEDASEKQLNIKEVFTGIMLVPAQLLKKWLPAIDNQNAQKEYYLPDIIPFAIAGGYPVCTFKTPCSEEVQGVNDPSQLAQLERFYQYQQACTFLKQGILIADPRRFDLRGTLRAGKDDQIDINTVLKGSIIIGNNVVIGPNVVLDNVTIGNNVVIKANCVIEDSIIEEGCQIGPFAHLRPGSYIGANAKVGNFVETKNTRLGMGSKACHLSYLGDATIGKNVNLGAGTITCNYDGVNKHATHIADNASIGANSSLVAPLTIGESAMVGAGSTITKNVPPNQLTLSRVKQYTVENWIRPKKEKEEDSNSI